MSIKPPSKLHQGVIQMGFNSSTSRIIGFIGEVVSRRPPIIEGLSRLFLFPIGVC